MTLEIANETNGGAHVALYKKSPLRLQEPAVAWAIVSPPPQGSAIFSISRGDYRVFARYSFSPEDPWKPVNQTRTLSLRRNNDSLSIKEVRLACSALVATQTRNVREVGVRELRTENNFSIGVVCYIQLANRDAYLPHFISSHGALIESLYSIFFLAAVNRLAV